MEKNKKKASKYLLNHGEEEEEEERDDLIHRMSRINVEDEGGYEYANIRELTGQPSERDRSTYRPYHWERRRYGY